MFPCPRTCLRIWSRETGSAIPSRVSPLILHAQAESSIINHQSSIINHQSSIINHQSGVYSRDSSRLPRRRPLFYLNLHTLSGQSRVYLATQLRVYIHTYVSEDCSGDGDGDEDNGNENRIGEGGRGTKKRKKPQNSCRRRARNGGDMGGKRKKCRKERAGSVAANSDNLGSYKEAGGGAQGAQGSSKICTSRESVSPLSRLIRGFRNKYH